MAFLAICNLPRQALTKVFFTDIFTEMVQKNSEMLLSRL